MFNVLIVDDEAIIRKGLRNIVDWESLQCIVCDEACDGVEGMEKIKKLKPDIVIVDIKMPGLNGLEMIVNTKEIIPHSKIIILTGYRDFEYLKKAIQCGAFDYILKPSKVDDINSIVRRAVSELEKEEETVEQMQSLKRNIETTIPLLKQKMLYDLLFNVSAKNEKQLKDTKLYDLQIDEFYILVIRIENSDNHDNMSMYHYGIINSLVDIYSDLFIVDHISINEETIVFVIQPVPDIRDDEEIEGVIKNKLRTLKKLIKEYYSFETVAALSGKGSGREELHRKMKEAIAALDEKLLNFTIDNKNIDIDKMRSIDYRDCEYRKDEGSSEKRSTSLIIRNAVEYISDNYTNPISLNDVAEHTYVSSYYLSRMFTKELGKNFVDYLNEVRIEKAKEYLKEDYHKTYEVADMVGIKDPHYFSKLFKKYTGLTPSEFKDKAD
ncbi:response regulator transcription factor [Clostridium oryzae]|uniref:Stage 0 sporulation protein A homolog n=1 Tax=Clostridium oryzae TaxID=1450648 RepID=A0A1V4INT4_9CLOT|nr:response regulator [Clostridium oryzae]OPJ61553.1 putative response regulatory protein [Clostridium oryzae]